jgi:hypothetical protein
MMVYKIIVPYETETSTKSFEYIIWSDDYEIFISG